MQIRSYTFQSPYPNQIQVGRPDPQVQQQTQQNETVNSFIKVADKSTQKEADAYLSQVKTAPSLNVASTSTNSGVSSALNSFSVANSQLQATAAYSG